MYSLLVRSSDLKIPIANQNNNLLTTMIIDNPTIYYSLSMENICIPMITRFDRLMMIFRDMYGNIMRLNDEFELMLTIEDVYDQAPSSIPQMNERRMIEVFASEKKQAMLGNPLSFDQCSISSVSLYTDYVLLSVLNDGVILSDAGI